MKQILLTSLPVVDALLVIFVYPSAWILRHVRRIGTGKLPRCRKALLRVGVFPIRNHYYEPSFDNRNPRKPFSEDRSLPGIDWNEKGQLEFLSRLSFSEELADIRQEKAGAGDMDFYLNNGSFASGDAEYWYQLIRAVQPKRIIEVGSGNSTLMAIKAIRKNREKDPEYNCELTCIEPYEMPWLEKTGVTVLRKKIEDMGTGFFSKLEENDVLFIDSTHIIRPEGDVLFEFLELLPTLNKGVIVHVHDIFSPRNYLQRWLEEDIRFWNEQYLLEAFLSHNGNWEILGALNYLHHHHPERLKAVAPFITPDREPGSFYMQKVA